MGKGLKGLIATTDPKLVERAERKAAEMLLSIHLAEVRAKVQKTQQEVAFALDVTQPTVAEMERPGKDMKLSSLKRYVEANGAKARIEIELPDGTCFGFAL